MKYFVFFYVFLLLSPLVFSQELNKKYVFDSSLFETDDELEYEENHEQSYFIQTLIFTNQNQFKFSQLTDESCYSYTDEVTGSWIKRGDTIFFPFIDIAKTVQKSKINLPKNIIQVKDFQGILSDTTQILCLNNNFEFLALIKSVHTFKEIYSVYEFSIPPQTAFIIYFNDIQYPILKNEFNDDGIQLTDFKTYNSFTIQPKTIQLLNPYTSFLIKSDHLISTKPFQTHFEEKRVFKLKMD